MKLVLRTGMSFGFPIGDFIAVGELSWRIYRSCKGSTKEFHEISREALTIHTVVKELQDELGTEQARCATEAGTLVANQESRIGRVRN